MGRNVQDLASLLAVIAGHDARAPLSLREDPAVFAQALDADVAGARVAWLGDWNGYLPMEAGILPLCRDALAALAGLGSEVSDHTVPFDGERLWRIWLTHRHLLAGGQLRPLWENPQTRGLLKPEAIWEAEGLQHLSAYDVLRASEERSAWYQAVLRLFEEFDFLAIPCAQVFPFDKNLDWPKTIAGRAMDTYHRWMEVVTPWTLAGCPVMSIPVGFNAAGLPMGMQVIGPPQGDLAVLRLCHAYEQSCDWVNQRPPELLGEQAAPAEPFSPA